MEIAKSERNGSIDFCKGILILLVILGHIILGELNKNIVRYVIYGFHMAVFFGISGYVFLEDKISRLNFTDMVKKYFQRIGLPWIIAINLYYVLNHLGDLSRMNFKEYIGSWVLTYYHLWFVPTYLAYIFITWLIFRIFKKNSSSFKYIILFVLGISITVLLKNMPTVIAGKDISLVIVGLKRIWQAYYLFFLAGILMQTMIKFCNRNMAKLLLVLAVVSLMGRVWLFGHANSIVSVVIRYSLGMSLLLLAGYICDKRLIKGCKIIEWFGRNSYAFYLWHVVAKMCASWSVGTEEVYKYYLANFFFFMLLCGIIYWGNKSKFSSMLLGGVNTKTEKEKCCNS